MAKKGLIKKGTNKNWILHTNSIAEETGIKNVEKTLKFKRTEKSRETYKKLIASFNKQLNNHGAKYHRKQTRRLFLNLNDLTKKFKDFF